MQDNSNRLHEILGLMLQSEASDLHLSARSVPVVRRDGRLEKLSYDLLTDKEVEELAYGIMHPQQRIVFDQQHSLDMAFALSESERFRVNVYRERGHVAIAIRRLDHYFHTFEDLHLPPQLAEFSKLRDGLVLITGPAGSGKTTTLATLIHQINCSRACHIVTIEDPIEYLHQNEKSLIHQREVNTDVHNFPDAVRSAMREDPDVILVGEMRDLETIRASITAAETGHLVFSTLHTGDAVGALERMVGVFPGSEQDAVRMELSMVLRAVVAQRLLPLKEGTGRIPAIEILQVIPAVAHLIRSGKPAQIYSAIETGTALGMRTMEQSLAELILKGQVRSEDARRLARDVRTLENRLKSLGVPVSGVN